MATDAHPVIIVGAGPVGLSLALGLARHGVRALVLEREPAPTPFSRALGVLPRTLEIFREWGLLEEFLAAGQFRTSIPIHTPQRTEPAATLDLGSLARVTAVPGLLILPQYGTETLLQQALEKESAVEVRWGHLVTGFREEAAGVSVEVAPASETPYQARCDYLVGCDGAHSVVREQLGWSLEGKTYPSRIALADVSLPDARDDLPWPRFSAAEGQVLGALRFDTRLWRLIYPVAPGRSEAEATAPETIAAHVTTLFGAGPFETCWSSVFNIHCRTSPHFRRGRVLLAGDAAHINSPAGGQGMNAGIQDAHNLAWKLARKLEGGTDALLHSYEQERQGAVLEEVDRYTDFLTRAVLLAHPWVRMAFLTVARVALGIPAVVERAVLRMAMLDTRYRSSALLTGQDRLVGCRAPDGALQSPTGQAMRLLDLVGPGAALLLFDDGRLPGWPLDEIRSAVSPIGRLQVVHLLSPATPVTPPPGAHRLLDAGCWSRWEADGHLAALVRPDGYVGWAAHQPTVPELRWGAEHSLGLAEDLPV